MIFFPISIISVYVTIYFILPRFILTGRYAAVSILLLILINFSIAYLLTMLLASVTTNTPFNQLPVSFKWFLPIRYGIGLPIVSAVLTTIIKLMKIWHLEEKENERLLKQKVRNEIQLLETQFQPHFLYDTLQEISSLIHKHSRLVPVTLLKLSELLSYLLYEVDKETVALEKELQMVKNFVNLKKIFYEKKLSIQFKEDFDKEMKISPLILLSLVENFFGQIIDPSPDFQSLTIEIRTHKKELSFLLESKADNKTGNGGRIPNHSWERSLKKIQLLYPTTHSFETYSEDHVTRVILILESRSIKTEFETKNETAVPHVMA